MTRVGYAEQVIDGDFKLVLAGQIQLDDGERHGVTARVGEIGRFMNRPYMHTGFILSAISRQKA